MNDQALAYLAITRLQHAYADVCTRRAWQEAASIITPDARLSWDIGSGEPIAVVGVAAFSEFGARATKGFSFYQYIPLNSVATVASDGTARGRAYALEVAEVRDSGDWVSIYGLYHDDYALLDGAWRFARRHYQTIGRRTNERMESFPIEDGPL